MPVNPTFPGVYVQELPSSVRPIAQASTSVCAFVGYTARGLDHRPKRLFSFADYERSFGGLAAESEVSYAVQQFFMNGGGEAYVVRVPKSDGVAAAITAEDGPAGGAKQAVRFTALSRGGWANLVQVDVDHDGIPAADTKAFNLTITDLATGESERFAAVTMDAASPRFVTTVVNDEDSGSAMVKVGVPDATAGRPMETGTAGGDITLASLKNDKDYSLKVSADVPTGKIANLDVTIIATGEAIPASVVGLARLVERKLSAAMGKQLKGAAVRVVPSSTGKGLRILPAFDPDLLAGSLDASLSFAAGAPNDIRADLKLDAATANVGHYLLGNGRAALGQVAPVQGKDGVTLPGSADLIGSPAQFTGIHALDKVDLFNILCIPDATRAKASDPATLDSGLDPNSIYAAALTFCEQKRAFLLVDPPPSVRDLDSATDWISGGLAAKGANAAAWFPRIRVADPLNDFKLRTFAPSGVIAGLLARTDANRGVWKAPAGTEAQLRSVQGLVYGLTDAENGVLNPMGLNCIRTKPIYGTLSWGTRTLDGADAMASQWKYVPVRRLALMIEESLFRGTQWVVFEPNDEPLWAQIRLNITSFMHGLFRQGAFQGSTPKGAYLVKCGPETTTQADIDKGIVNILVGFAPLKPAEFVIIQIQQLAGQGAA